uniref:Venom peptide HtLa7 n=1 Tax=Hadogenes troglodytes TaxID=1577150 RepID=A0A1B3IJ36_9SCOR|nr:venom peptide HtLa7 [Hadogenes troglodytes]
MERSTMTVLLGFLLVCSFFSASLGLGETCKVGQFTIPVGQQANDLTACVQYKCLNYNRRYALETLSCAKQTLKSGCHITLGAAGAPFPNCCPTVICRGG